MKMKYLTYLNHLSAILTIIMICFQAGGIVSGTIENKVLDHGANSSLSDNLSKDQLSSMSVSELRDIRYQVDQELRLKYLENMNNLTMGELVSQGYDFSNADMLAGGSP
ncbi:MAG TPA: hypothetical protein VN455_13555 [Methanotrichaceae archaeon]|nr:hypothetical protein [Methanotrichaceae archaeon]